MRFGSGIGLLLLLQFTTVYADKEVSTSPDVYSQCVGCHAPSYNRTGPLHCGVFGRGAGLVRGFEYTPAMKRSGIVWDRKTLDTFLRAPFEMVPGTSMGFAGIQSVDKRRKIIDFLSTLDHNNPACR